MSLSDELTTLLQQDPRLVVDGQLLKNRITELALKLDRNLLRLLLSRSRLKEHFFADVDGVLVFDKEKFIRFVNNKAFLPDSYTSFANKIGLTTPDGRYLSESRDVVLAWPYKDCVLEGGQTREEQTRDEIFWNELLAPDEIDRLLAPKVLTAWRRYDADGEHSVTELGDADNLVMKGNNLLAVHSLKRRYAGKVKLIYIDPPYNTGNDSFGYNDRFNHSTWLTFMRNRLEAAQALLCDDGSIWINIDDDEAHYLKVLCDEVFLRENFVVNVIWQKKYTRANDARFFSDNHDHILVFAKNKQVWKVNKLPRTADVDEAYSNPDNHPKGPWKATPLHAKSGTNTAPYTFANGVTWSPPPGTYRRFNDESMRKMDEDNEIWFGHDRDQVPQRKSFLVEMGDLTPTTIWGYKEVGHNHEAKNEIKSMFAENPFSSPKPERLIQRIIHLASDPGDLVLDFYLGSGTTAAVAHKMGRRYIGIEQMDYIEDITVKRLRKVIAGERGGISEAVGWQGGGSVVYCKLMQWNEHSVQRILAARDKATMQDIWDGIREKAHLSYRLDMRAFDAHAAAFSDLTLEDQRRFLMEVLDKNQLYVPFSEIDDGTYGVNDEDKRLNRQFYGV